MNPKELFSLINRKLNFSLRRRVPVLLQSESAECALTCLTMLSAYHGLQVDIRTLRRFGGLSAQGATLPQLSQIAGQIALKTRALSLDLGEICQLRTPCILHWNMNHFVVLVKVRRTSFVIHDPASGRRIVGLQEMSKAFSGVALEVWPDHTFEKGSFNVRLRLMALAKNIEGLPGILLKLFSLSVVIETVNLLLPVGTQLVADYVIQAHDHSLLLVICLGLITFTLFRTFVSAIRAGISIKLSALTDVQWKASLFDHLLRLPLTFFERRKLGDIQSRFGSLDAIRTTLTGSIVSGIIDSIMTVGLFSMMLLYGGWLVWVVTGFTLCYVLLRGVTYRVYHQVSEEQIVKSARAGSFFMETLYGIGSVKSLGLETIRGANWLNLNADAANSGIRLTRFNMLFGGINAFITSFDQVTILWLGAMAVVNNHMTLGMFMAFNAYRGQFSSRAGSLVDLLISLRMLTLHNDRLSDIVFSEPEHTASPHRLFPPDAGVGLEARGVSFRYDVLSGPVFRDLFLTVRPGESIAITGPSGCGKTTLLKTLCGLNSLAGGKILAGGLDIHRAGINNYRGSISCVMQDDRLFAGTIAENICGFDNAPDTEWIAACAQRSHIHEEIMAMPMGYETLIGELGTGLSGGQKQRLFIARALYRRPCILFMDEATSHLDLDSERMVNASIASLNITRVIVAHRPSTIASADRVIILGPQSGEE